MSSTVKRPMGKKEEEFVESGFFRFLTSKITSTILGILCLLVGLFAAVDYWGPRTTSREKILGFPNGGNYALIRTDKSYFPIDERLAYETSKMHDAAIDVDKSMTGVPLSFELPELTPGVKYYPLSHRYSYISLQIICLLFGLVLLFYKTTKDNRMYFVFLGMVAFACGLIPMIGMEVTINSIYAEHTLGW